FHRELHPAVHQGEQGVVLAEPDVHARMEPRATLAHDDRSCGHHLAAERLDAQHLRIRIATVAGRAAALLLCHCLLLLIRPTGMKPTGVRPTGPRQPCPRQPCPRQPCPRYPCPRYPCPRYPCPR